MSINQITASKAYLGQQNLKANFEKSKVSFKDILSNTQINKNESVNIVLDQIKSLRTNLVNHEQQSKLLMQGKANMTDVVDAINKAQFSLKMVIGIRDAIVKAFGEITNMQI